MKFQRTISYVENFNYSNTISWMSNTSAAAFTSTGVESFTAYKQNENFSSI